MAPVLTTRGCAHRKLGNLREAVCDADEALRSFPSCAEAFVVRGQAQLDLGDAVNAMADLAKAIELSHAQGARFAASTAYAAKADACVTLQCYDQAVNDCDEVVQDRQGDLPLSSLSILWQWRSGA
ncbi:unnamed protein product, partial [Polarella glacialis]